MTLDAGSRKNLTVTIAPSGASQTFTHSSTNPIVATYLDGSIAAMSEGTTDIEFVTDNGLKATLKVTVRPAVITP